MTPRHIVAASVAARDGEGRVLLIRSPARGWELPGGQVEEGEGLTQAAAREAFEESGLRVEIGALIGVYSSVSAPAKVIFLFSGQAVGGTLTTSGESLEVGWFAPEEAFHLMTHEPGCLRLSDALANFARPVYRVYETRPFKLLSSRDL